MDPHPAGKPMSPRVKRSAANDCTDPQMVKTEQQTQERQHRVSRANTSVSTWRKSRNGLISCSGKRFYDSSAKLCSVVAVS